MRACILEKYDPTGKDALFESFSALYVLDQGPTEIIIDCMSCTCRLFSGLHDITFNTIDNLFAIVNSDHDRFGALADRFQSRDPEVINAEADIIKTLLDKI